MTLVLNGAEVRAALPVDACIDAMDRALREFSARRVTMPNRLTLEVGDAGYVQAMPAHVREEGLLGAKLVSNFPGNKTSGVPVILGAVLLHDAETGEIRAIMDAATITGIRTAAVTALATRTLAREDARELALIGAGAQAAEHLRAVTTVRPIERVRVASRTSESARAFVERFRQSFPRLDIVAEETARAAVDGADVVCAVSSATRPVTSLAWLKPGCHVNGVGAHAPDIREIDGETMQRGRVVVDSREAILRECGDCIIPLAEGLFEEGHVSDELGEVLAGTKPGRASDDELTVFQSCGLAVEDVAAAHVAYANAKDQGVGTEVSL